MAEGHKAEKMREYIIRGVDSYLCEHSDTLGFCHVDAVILSGDLRSAKILVVGDNTVAGKKLENLLNSSKNGIVKKLKEIFSTKFLPKITFIGS